MVLMKEFVVSLNTKNPNNIGFPTFNCIKKSVMTDPLNITFCNFGI